MAAEDILRDEAFLCPLLLLPIYQSSSTSVGTQLYDLGLPLCSGVADVTLSGLRLARLCRMVSVRVGRDYFGQAMLSRRRAIFPQHRMARVLDLGRSMRSWRDMLCFMTPELAIPPPKPKSTKPAPQRTTRGSLHIEGRLDSLNTQPQA